MVVSNSSSSYRTQIALDEEEELRQMRIAEAIAGHATGIDGTPFGLAVRGQIVVFADPVHLPKGSGRSDYHTAYPRGKYFDYYRIFVIVGNQSFVVYRIIPRPDGTGRDEVMDGGIVESEIPAHMKPFMEMEKVPAASLEDAGIRPVFHFVQNGICIGCGIPNPRTGICSGRMLNHGYPE